MKHADNHHFQTAALFLAQEVKARRLKSILVCSATPGEGTTTVVWNIACELKQTYALDPLVLELNWQRPVLAKALRLDSTRSAQALASGSATIDECLQAGPYGVKVVVAAKTPPGGNPSINPTLLEPLLGELSGRADLVLVDGPPLLGQAAGMAIGAVVPSVLLVVEAGRTRYEVLDRLQNDLATQKMAVVATVLNKQKRVIPAWIYRMLIR